MTQAWIPASFYRGGTSKGVFFHARDLPTTRAAIDPILLSVIGTPDPYGRQLNGMGGGISSLSKAVIIGPSTHPDADVDYTFIQLAVDRPMTDWSGNCGNLSSAVGPFAIDEGLVKRDDGEVTVRFHQTNTRKIIHARFRVEGGQAAVDGDMEIAGVSGRGAPVRLDFVNPGGATTGKLLPTGNVVDLVALPGESGIAMSLVDASHPTAFLRATDLGLTGTEAPEAIESDSALMGRLDRLRRRAGVMMGLGATPDDVTLMSPRIAMVAAPQAFTAIDKAVFDDDHDIVTRMISMERPHRAVPLASALCLAVACRIEGTLPNLLARRVPPDAPIRVANPSGLLAFGADVRLEGRWIADSAGVYRTARRLMQGQVAAPRRLVAP
ncbi:MAG: PrpF domain-containing protein [Beijerinckiaceae bacterium]|nr:PrpF domain-containing protein [Beijerinckiaceae bacterium]